MQDNFQSCLSIILKEEGGNDDDPRDPGGRTSRGIIQREWDVFRQNHPNRPQDVWKASNEDVAAIYHDQYWEPYCDKMPSGIDLVFFNTCVNSGRQQAVKELQRGLGINPADGMLGMITQNALADFANITDLIKDLCERRRRFYNSLSQKWKKTFLKGVLGRTDRIEKSALSMATSVHPNVVIAEHPEVDTLPDQPNITISPKAPETSADKPVVAPETGGAIAAGTGSLMGALSKIKEQLADFAAIDYVQYVLLAITVISIAYMVFGIIKQNRVKAAMSNA
jgi:lysozyme family protein